MPVEVDRLKVGGEFDPAGITRGVDIGTASLEEFERVVRQVDKSTKQALDVTQLARLSAEGVRQLTATTKAYEDRVREVIRLANQQITPVPIITRDKVAELKVLAGQLQQNIALTEDYGKANARLIAGMSAAGAAAARQAEGNAKMAAGFAAASGGTEAHTQAVTRNNRAISLARTGLVTLASQAVGTTTVVGNLAQSMILLAGGATGVILLAGAVLLLAKAWEMVTVRSREAKKTQDDLLKAFRSRVEGLDVSNEANQRGAARGRILELQEKELRLQERMSELGKADVGGWLALRYRLAKNQNEQQELTNKLKRDEIELNKQLRDINLENARAAAEAFTNFQKIVLAGQQQLQKFRQDMTALGPQTFTMPEGKTGVRAGQQFLSDQEKASFQERIALARRLTEIETSGLRVQLALLQAIAPKTTQEAAERKGKVAALEAEIRLREEIGRQQVVGLQLEEATTAELRRQAKELGDHLDRVERAGGGNLLGATPLGAVSLPTDADVAALAQALARVPPVGLPTPEEARRAWDAAYAEARKLNIPSILQGAVQQGLRPGEGEAQAIQEAREQAVLLREAWEQVADSALRAVQITSDMGQALAQALGTAFQLVASFEDIRQANKDLKEATTSSQKLSANLDKISAIGGLIQTGISFIGGLIGALGPTEAEREAIVVQKENNARLRELRDAIDRELEGARGAAQAGAAARFLAELATRPLGRGILQPIPAGVGGARDTDKEFRIVNAALERFGLTFDQLNRIAKENGIQLLDKKGRIVAESFDQLADAMGITLEALTKFSDGMADRAAQMELEDRFRRAGGGGKVTPLDDLNRNRRLLLEGLQLDPGLESRIASLNLDSEEGRRAYLEFLKWLFEMGKAGAFTAEQLNDFPSADDLFGPIEEGVDSVTQAHEDAAQAARDLAAAQEEAARQFREAFPTLLDLRRRLSGLGDDLAAQFGDALTGLAFEAPELAQLFAGFNVNDPASREALRKRMLEIVEQILSGQLGAEQLGITPETFQTFLDFLAQGTDILDAFNQALEEGAENLKRTLGELQNELDLRSRLAGETQDATTRFQEALAALSTLAPDFAAQLGDFDLSDPASREALRQKLLDLFDAMRAGNFKPEDIGLTMEDFLHLIGEGADFLDSFNESVQDATKSLSNMPRAINLEALEFAAQAAGRTIGDRAGGPATTRELRDAITRPPRQVGSDGAQLPVIKLAEVATATDALVQALTNGRMTANLQKLAEAILNVKPGDTFVVLQGAAAEEVIRKLKRKSMGETGSPDNWGRTG